MRDHIPIALKQFNGLWLRGDADDVPQDHFIDCNNITFKNEGFRTRDGIEPLLAERTDGSRDIVRMYTYNTDLDGLIVLDTNGDFYHIIPNNPAGGGPLITFLVHVDGAEDFTFVNINGRAYINPFSEGGLTDFIYVYNGDFTPARKAGGVPPVDADGALAAANSGTAGNVEAGIHIFGVVYETDSGFNTEIGPTTLAQVTATGTKKVALTNIPVSPNSYVDARRIVASKAIDPSLFTGDLRGYELFFVPDGDIADNTTTSLTVNFYDTELLESAADLFDIMSEVPSGVGLIIYHNRLIVIGQYSPGIAQSLVSLPGEYEAFNEIDGLILQQNDGLGVIAGFEYRDILYLMKINETTAYADSGDVPSSWPATVLDEGFGSAIHGVCYVDTRTGMNSEFVVILNYSGIFIFNGVWQKPELTYKIKEFWLDLSQVGIARNYEIYNDVLKQVLYICIPELFMILIGDYTNGLNAKDIKWGKWTFDVEPTTITLFDKDNDLLIGSNGEINPDSALAEE